MDKKYDEISFCVKNYVDYDEMMYDVKDCLTLLMKNRYQAQVYDEDHYVVIVKFNHRDINMSGVSLEWVDEEKEMIVPIEKDDDYESYDNYIMASEIDELF